MKIIINNIKTSIDNGPLDAINIVNTKYLKGIKYSSIKLFKTSIDARNNNLSFINSVIVDIDKSYLKHIKFSYTIYEEKILDNIKRGNKKITKSPIIIGFGPAGMFCGLLLAYYGFAPIILEKGADVDQRINDVDEFWNNASLNTSSNVQFGEGGAGTFSDGKLLTRINNPLCNYVIKCFTKYGAPDDILYKAKPHVGTNKLRTIVKNIRKEIEALGGKVIFNCEVNKINYSKNKITSVFTNKGEFGSSLFVLAIGHSSRELFNEIHNIGVNIINKPFSVGFRIEHEQNYIENIMYKKYAGHKNLPKPEYQISNILKDERCVYTFCMCPGGSVIAASSNIEQIVTNGMSNYERNNINSNSALVVSVNSKDFGNEWNSGIKFQESIEKKAYLLTDKTYKAPIMTLGEFLNIPNTSNSNVIPSYPIGTKQTNFKSIFPNFVIDSITESIDNLDKKLIGFKYNNAILTAPETRTSSPIRINRLDELYTKEFNNFYPCGEGAGYSGGITSSAVDGLKVAIKIINEYVKE